MMMRSFSVNVQEYVSCAKGDPAVVSSTSDDRVLALREASITLAVTWFIDKSVLGGGRRAWLMCSGDVDRKVDVEVRDEGEDEQPDKST